MKKGNLIITIIVGFVLISIVMTGLGYVMTSKGESGDVKKMMEDERIETAVNLANVIAAASIDPLFNEDDFVINETINSALKASDGLIAYIYVLDKNKKVWGDTKNPTNVLKPFSDSKIKTLKSENRSIQKISETIFNAGVPILAGKNKIGEVHIGVKYPVVSDSSSGSFMPFIIMLITGIVGAIIISVLVSKLLANAGAEFATSLKSAKLDELRKQEDEAQKDLSAKNKNIKETESKIEETNAKLKEIGSRYDEVMKTIDNSDEKLAEKEKQMNFFENKISELEKKQKELKSDKVSAKDIVGTKKELVTLKSQVNNFKLQLQQTINEIETKRKEENTLTDRIKQFKIDLSKAGTGAGAAPISSQDIEQKKKNEIEITQRIVAKRKEEIALSQRIELKRKKELELTGRIELLEKKLKEMGTK